jgi:hypothetical protein
MRKATDANGNEQCHADENICFGGNKKHNPYMLLYNPDHSPKKIWNPI